MKLPDFYDCEHKPDVEPNEEMERLRAMLNEEGIEWADTSDPLFCRTQQHDGDRLVFSAVSGAFAWGDIEVWTARMIDAKEDPLGVGTAEEAMVLIRETMEAIERSVAKGDS